MKFAGLVQITHQCECEGATEPPGEDGIVHELKIDGEDFPWYISEEGPRVYQVGEGMYEVTVTVLCQAVELNGIEVQQYDPEDYDDFRDYMGMVTSTPVTAVTPNPAYL